MVRAIENRPYYTKNQSVANVSLLPIDCIARKLLSSLAYILVRYCKFLASLSATRCQYATAVLCGHSLTETVFVLPLSV